MGAAEESPLMRQYADIKKQHQDAILLFRMGDFYEMFFEDAEVASKLLEIALTSRDKNAERPVPLCGVPYHSISGYITTLLDNGHKVAICEQVEDPKLAKGIVRREVVRVISPGLQTDAEGLGAQEINPLVSLAWEGEEIGLAWLDAASGRFEVSVFHSKEDAESELWRLSPREIVLPEERSGSPLEELVLHYQLGRKGVRFERTPSWVYTKAEARLSDRFNVSALSGFGLTPTSLSIPAATALLYYVEESSRTSLPHLQPPKPYSTHEYLHMDLATRENLEVLSSSDGSREHSLFGVLDQTKTSMGSRMLRTWLSFPLREVIQIDRRLEAVDALFSELAIRENLRRELADVYDLERLIGRVASGRTNARDLLALRSTLNRVSPIRALVELRSESLLAQLAKELDPHVDLVAILDRAIVEEPPLTIREGGMIRDGYNAELDQLRSLTRGGRQWIAELERRERERTGISSLKVGFNRVFGYYLEITKSNLDRVPEDYLRKQTLAGAERFVTPALKEEEAKILGAEERISNLEYELFEDIRREAAESTRSLQRLADALSTIDVLASLAHVASVYRYSRPRLNQSDGLRIVAGRHPVVERFLTDTPFVPNSIQLDVTDRQMVILTGPNMAGKSTIMRQVGLITVMAHMGSFVPAEEVEMGTVDRVFTRVGASDNLVRGQSTFMVEMSETANILRNATKRSLVLLDEIGRGTSTFDGLSIAWAVAEDLHDRVGSKTLFATHYHELTDLARTKSRVKNMNVAVKEWGDRIVFVRTLAEGAVNRSYGIEVARLAGVPQSVIDRAREILVNLERSELDATGKPSLAESRAKPAENRDQLDLFRRLADDLYEEVRRANPDELTPRRALDLLFEWRSRFQLKP